MSRLAVIVKWIYGETKGKGYVELSNRSGTRLRLFNFVVKTTLRCSVVYMKVIGMIKVCLIRNWVCCSNELFVRTTSCKEGSWHPKYSFINIHAYLRFRMLFFLSISILFSVFQISCMLQVLRTNVERMYIFMSLSHALSQLVFPCSQWVTCFFLFNALLALSVIMAKIAEIHVKRFSCGDVLKAPKYVFAVHEQ